MVGSNLTLEQKRDLARQYYPGQWAGIVNAWQGGETTDAAWLTYAASYLLKTGGARWAVDPFSLSTRVEGVSQPNFVEDLRSLEFAVLTHAHADHLDLNLITALANSPARWIIPGHMLERVLTLTPLPHEKVMVPVNGVPLELGDVRLTPFESLHFHELGGVEETGYLAEFGDKRWLFPGDIRNFDRSRLPDFGRLDGVFAHLWLGKGYALNAHPPLLDAFCDFFTNLNAERVVVTHIDEIGRPANELWEDRHYELVAEKMKSLHGDIQIESAKTGGRVNL